MSVIDPVIHTPGSRHGPHIGSPVRFPLDWSPHLHLRPLDGDPEADLTKVLKKLKAQWEKMPSPGNFFQSIKSLNTYDKGLLAKQTDTLMPLSAAQQKAFASSVSKALASAEGKPVLEDAAAAAAGACKDIKSQFVNLHQKLINIDGARAAADPNAVRFGPKLAALEMV